MKFCVYLVELVYLCVNALSDENGSGNQPVYAIV